MSDAANKAHTAEKDAGLQDHHWPLAQRLVNERMAYYGYTPEQIESASFEVDHYAIGCSMDGNFGWDCQDESGKSFHPESDEYDQTAEFVVWVLEHALPVQQADCPECQADLTEHCGACGWVR